VSAPGGVPIIRMPHLSHGGRRYFAKARSSAGFNPLPGGAIKAASKFLLSHPRSKRSCSGSRSRGRQDHWMGWVVEDDPTWVMLAAIIPATEHGAWLYKHFHDMSDNPCISQRRQFLRDQGS
jgi:hypothetical protein